MNSLINIAIALVIGLILGTSINKAIANAAEYEIDQNSQW